MRKVRITTHRIPSNADGYYLEWRLDSETTWNREGGLRTSRFADIQIPDGSVHFSILTKFKRKGVVSQRSDTWLYKPEITPAPKVVPVPTVPDTKAEEGTTVIQPALPPDTPPNTVEVNVRVSPTTEADPSNALEVVNNKPVDADTEIPILIDPTAELIRVWLQHIRTDDRAETVWAFFDLVIQGQAGNVRDDSFDFSGAIDILIDGEPTIVDDGGGGIEAAAGPDPYVNVSIDPYAIAELDPYLTDAFMQEMRFYGPKVSANEIRETWLQLWPTFAAAVKHGTIDPYDSTLRVYADPPNNIENESAVPAPHVTETDPYATEPDISPPIMDIKIAKSNSGSPTFVPADFVAQRPGQLITYRTYQPRFSLPRRGIGGKKLTIAQMITRRYWHCCPCDCVVWQPWS